MSARFMSGQAACLATLLALAGCRPGTPDATPKAPGYAPRSEAPAPTAGTPVAKNHGGIDPQVVAAWEKAGARFGWFTNVEFGMLDHLNDASRVQPQKPAAGAALPSFAMTAWPPPGGLDKLPKPTVPFGLSLARRKVTDGWMKDVAAFGHLQALDLSYTEVTDAGLKELAAAEGLQGLYLVQTPVTDAGLKELAALKQMYTLDVTSAKVTAAGVAELRKTLPKLAVYGTPAK